MEQKTFPPVLGGDIVAGYLKNGKIHFEIPFTLNRATSTNMLSIPPAAIIKTVPLGAIKTFSENDEIYYNSEKTKICLNLTEDFMIQGGYYKAQFALNNGEGYYSTPILLKYTTLPELSFTENFSSTNSINSFSQTIRGYYRNIDLSETLYSSQFFLEDLSGNLLEKSEEIIHNVVNDINNSIYEDCHIKSDLVYPNKYRLIWKIKTVSGLEVAANTILTPFDGVAPQSFNLRLKAEVENSNGCVKLYLLPEEQLNGVGLYDILLEQSNIDIGYLVIKDNITNEKIFIDENSKLGTYIIQKKKQDNKSFWEDVAYIELLGGDIVKQIKGEPLLIDTFVENEKRYSYSLQEYQEVQYGETEERRRVLSFRKILKDIFVEYEYVYLCDKYKQLKINLNTQISSFKTQILEQKQETIGSKFPFIFRNNNVGYKELPISFLTSYLTDDLNLFSNLYNELENETNLTFNNIEKERQFKNLVMDWLQNGEIKFLKSPTEGCYPVRVINVSMSPQQTLGRMLHTVNATLVQIADSYNSLITLSNRVYPKKDCFITETYADTLELKGSTGSMQIYCDTNDLPLKSVSVVDLLTVPVDTDEVNEEAVTMSVYKYTEDGIVDPVNFLNIGTENETNKMIITSPGKRLSGMALQKVISCANNESIEFSFESDFSNCYVQIVYSYELNIQNFSIVKSLKILERKSGENLQFVAFENKALSMELISTLNGENNLSPIYFNQLHFTTLSENAGNNCLLIDKNGKSLSLKIVEPYSLYNFDILKLYIDFNIRVDCAYRAPFECIIEM